MAEATEKAQRITNAMRTLPRDHFIEMSDPSLVLGRSIPPTNAVSEILNHTNVRTEHRVLQVGTGAGNVAALLSKLAAQVVTLENNAAIARFAQARFNKLGLANLVMLSEARRIARQKKLPIINVLRDKLNMEDTTWYHWG
jgi:protein-L-isoaspartate O-methyltransferase